jgi:prepilin-type N-terminal cleavage/methylation domain-containing protein
MNKFSRKRGFTLVELLVVIAIMGILIGLLLPAISKVRESARRAACTSNIRQIGTALQGFHDTYREFPPAGEYSKVMQTNATSKYGYSWLVLLLPFVDNKTLYETMKIKQNPDPMQNRAALQTRLAAFSCPSYSGVEFVNPAMGSETASGGITNYKAMGATTQVSMDVGKMHLEGGKATVVPYGKETAHPDGAMNVGTRTNINAFADGMSNTIMACETREEGVTAEWQVGQYAAVVGLPPGYTFQPLNLQTAPYNVPVGFVLGSYENDSPLRMPENGGTYLAWDCDVQQYDVTNSIKYGPSSFHSGVVNHLFGDNTVRSITLTVDPALYMFVITRSGGDPADIFYSKYR